MRHRVIASALLAVVVAACGGDSKITAPQTAASKVRVLAAVGTDAVTGATIETNLDDYLPGGTVFLVGRGWAPNETVQLVMTEDPDTHGDVSKDVRADASGAFSVEFYVVQQSDLGATFTLTATGQTSGSKATAVFTDGNLSVDANGLPNAGGSRVFSPNADGNLDDVTLNAAINGSGAETNVLIDIRSGTSMSGTSVRTLGPVVDYNPPPNGLAFTRVWDGTNTASVDVAEGIYTARIYSTLQPLPSAPNEVTGARRVELLVDRTAPVISAVQLTPSATTPGASITLTATATDALTAITAAEYRIDLGAWLPMTPTAPPFNALSEGLTVTFTAPGSGSYNVCVRARDVGLTWSNGNSCATLVVAGVNQPPTADAKGPYLGNEGSPITISGTATDADGTIASTTWSVSSAPAGVTCTFGDASLLSTTVTCNDNSAAAITLTLTAIDDDGASSSSNATLTVANVAPTATFNASSPVSEGSPIGLSLTAPVEPSTVDAATLKYAFDCGSGYGALSATSTASCATTDNGSRTVKGKIQDKDGGFTEYTANVTINNVAPTAVFSAPSPVNEGSAIGLSLTGAYDPSSDDVDAGLEYAFDCGTGGGYGPLTAASTASCPTTDNGSRTVKGKIQDKDGGFTEYSANVTVNNVAPNITSLTVPLVPVVAGNVTVSWQFDDPGTADTWSCQISWDTGLAFEPSVQTFTANPTKTCSATKTLGAGIYTVTVKVTDDDGGSDTETTTTYIVVYDPNGGFVTGGGWIMSPVNAYAADPSLTGKATFGFVSKYEKGATTPTGNTEFQFHAGSLNFKSTSYDWLVVAGTRAQYKGDGTVNGATGFGFLLTAIDDASGGDKFRIKIWNKATSAIVYDNQVGQAEDSDAATGLSGGSIVIHTKK